jgi:hypothetical protein
MLPDESELSYERDFQIWLYTVSHGQLLLRSNRSAERGTRVDILFKGVDAIQLPTVLQGLTMAKTPRPEALEISKKLGIRLRDSADVFVLRGAHYVGFVIAGAAFVHEDEGQHYDPSYFASSFFPRNQP